MSVFASPGYIEQFGLPQELDDLREHHIVDHTTLHSLPAMKPWSEVVERSSNVVLRTNSSHSAMEAVTAPWGLSVLPRSTPHTASPIDGPVHRHLRTSY